MTDNEFNNHTQPTTVEFNFNNEEAPSIIKVVGVGGGGSNAVRHMYQQGIHDVNFVLCNTDLQALNQSDIPVKLQLGPKLCEGLGAGNDPKVGHDAAEESIDEIKALFNDGTQMVFVNAGMGGGTGTGAAPVIARIAKEMGLLTVGIVTIPFLFERNPKILQALEGVESMQRNVDALLVINNERLREIYTDGVTSMREAFKKADDILAVATKSIAEIITMEGNINLDFRDVKKTLKDGGVAILSTGQASGEHRLREAIDNALRSPLLNDNDISKAKKIMFNISWSKESPLLIEEMSEIDRFMENLDPNIEVIWGEAEDDKLGKDVKFTVLATGFDSRNLPGMESLKEQRTKEEEEAKEETELRNQQRIDHVYGRTSVAPKRKRPLVYLLSQEDLDNDELISRLEESATFTRERSGLNALKDLSQSHSQAEVETNEEATQGGQEETPETISFS